MNVKRFLLGLVAASAWVACQPVRAAEPAGAVTDEQIRAWIGKLASEEFAVREEATERLAACGPAAKPALEAAAQSADPEVRFRARTALQRLGRGAASAVADGKDAGSRRAATSVSISQGPQGIRVEMTEDRDGKSERTVYEAPDREAFKEKHPEIFEKYLAGGGLGFGGIQVFMGGPAQAFVLQEDAGEAIDLEVELDEVIEQQAQVMKQFRVLQVPQPFPVPAIDEPAPRRDLGIRFDGVPEALSAQLGIAGGALVTDVVPGGAAARAGLARWDIIASFAGKKVASPAELRAALRDWTGEKPAAVSVIREGKPREIQVSLDAAAAGK